MIRSGIPWKCTFSQPATSITYPPPPPPFLTNGHTCRPDFPAAPMTRIWLPSHFELPPAASSAGHLFHKKAFKTTVGCKEKRLSLKPIVVAAWTCIIKKLMKKAPGCVHAERQRSFDCRVLCAPIWVALMRLNAWNRPLGVQPARSHTRRPPESTSSPHKATPPASPGAAPRLPTSAVFSPPSLPPGSERSLAFAHNHCFLVHARALSVLILTHFWTFRIFFFRLQLID